MQSHILLARQDTHTGSYWISELLSSQRVSSFFQFSGRCAGDANSSLPHQLHALARVFERGCGCLGVRGQLRERAYCTSRCSTDAPAPTRCLGVAAMVSPGTARVTLTLTLSLTLSLTLTLTLTPTRRWRQQ